MVFCSVKDSVQRCKVHVTNLMKGGVAEWVVVLSNVYFFMDVVAFSTT